MHVLVYREFISCILLILIFINVLNVLGLNLDSIQEAVLLLTKNRSLHGILTQVKETSAYNSYITDNTLRITNIESDDTITPGVGHLLTSCLYNSRPVKEALFLETRLKFE